MMGMSVPPFEQAGAVAPSRSALDGSAVGGGRRLRSAPALIIKRKAAAR
jgi:hypothetical protein